MKRACKNPSSPRAVLAEQVEKARLSETRALQVLLDRRKELLALVAHETETLAEQRHRSKMADLDDAIRLRRRELKQLYPDRIQKIVRSHAADPRTSQQREAIAKVTWAKPHRG